MNNLYIIHYGVGHDKGGHSGRYPWGSGDNPRGDERKLKRLLKKNIRKAKRANRQMVGNRFFQGNKQWLALDSGETLPFFKMGFWGRQIYKESIERYYKQNPKFRNEVKRAKQTWIDVGKENEKIANSFIDNYKSNKLAKANDYDINNAKKFIDKYKKQVKKYAGVSDTEFATRYLFDDYKNKNRVLFAIDTVMFIREMASILGSDSGN